jgi:hypothetical protein
VAFDNLLGAVQQDLRIGPPLGEVAVDHRGLEDRQNDQGGRFLCSGRSGGLLLGPHRRGEQGGKPAHGKCQDGNA